MGKPLVIIGAGGHASVLVDILKQQNRDILGLVSPEIESKSVFSDIEHLKNDDDILKFDKEIIKLVNGIGSLPGSSLRSSIYDKFKALGYEFETIIASNALVSSHVELQEGVQILTGSIIQTGAIIGANTIINSGAIIEHDCNVGKHNHIAPSATLSGGVVLNNNVHVGTGANIIHLVKIGKDTVIGAGVTITKNIPSGKTVYPAKNFIK